MNIKKIAYTMILILSIGVINAQKPLSKASIQDFANACEFQSQYNQDHNFMLVTLWQHISNRAGNVQKADIAMRSTGIDLKAREMVFEAFSSISGGDPDKLFLYLNQWGLSAAHAKEISTYISTKYPIKEEAPEEPKNGPRYDFAQYVAVDTTEKFFQGTKSFAGHIDDVYKVTVSGNKIKILESNDYNAVPFEGTIRKGRILDKTGKEAKFRYRDGILYYHGSKDEWYLLYELKE